MTSISSRILSFAAMAAIAAFTCLSATAQSLTFSPTSLPVTAPYTYNNEGAVTVTNGTGSSITVPTISISGTNSADFSQTNTCGTSIAAGASCTVEVLFSATQIVGSTEVASMAFGTTNIPLSGMVTAGRSLTSYDSCATSAPSNCLSAFTDAFTDAKNFYLHCATNGNTSPYTITIPAGTYDLSSVMGSNVPINFPILRACGTLLLTGAGSGITKVLTNNTATTINGTNISNITIQGISFSRNDANGFSGLGVTQGTVTAINNTAHTFTVTIPTGYPTPKQLYDFYSPTTMYVKAFDNTTPSAPVVVYNNSVNVHIPFGTTATTCTGSSCVVTMNGSNTMPSLYTNTNIIACFKMEASQAFHFSDLNQTAGNAVGFNDVIWYDSARGDFRNINNAFVTNSAIKRRAAIGGQAECVATWAGGPQFGQETDPDITGVTVKNFSSDGTGDDTIEIFNDGSGTLPNTTEDAAATLSNIVIGNSFGRDIALYQSCGVPYAWSADLSTKLTHCNKYDNSGSAAIPTSYVGCITDSSPSGSMCSPEIDNTTTYPFHM